MNSQPDRPDQWLAARIRARRRELQFTQYAVAISLDWKPQKLSDIENGYDFLSESDLVALARVLRCEPDWLTRPRSRFVRETA